MSRRRICFIPSFHIDWKGKKSAMLQVIVNEHVWTIHYAPEQFYAAKGRLYCRVGEIFFRKMEFPSISGQKICDERNTCVWKVFHAKEGYYGAICRVPLMQCRHEVISMRHSVAGTLEWNREKISFYKGKGY